MTRPQGAKGHKPVVMRVALERHKLLESGKAREATTLELVLLMLRNQALAGDDRCVGFLADLAHRYAPDDAKPAGYLIITKPPSPEEWEAEVFEQQRKYRTGGFAPDDATTDD